MILADDIIAAVGTQLDVGGVFTSMAKSLVNAERFVLTDDVADAGYDLISSRPTSLLAAMPMCRVPYPTMWLEWSGAASNRAGWPVEPVTELMRDDPRLFNRTTPIKLGCLIESMPADKGERGRMTWAWMMPNHTVSASGMSVFFDYTGNVREWGLAANNGTWMEPLIARWGRNIDEQGLTAVMTHSLRWGKLANDPVQRNALKEMQRFEMFWFSPHAWGMIERAITDDPSATLLNELIRAWIGDVCGEASFIDCTLVMLNSKNALQHVASADVTKLNKHRAKKGKPALLPHRITWLHVSKTQQRVGEARGMSRADIRAHLVRGHFKLRKTGVYWWSPFVRGTAGGLERRHYEVQP